MSNKSLFPIKLHNISKTYRKNGVVEVLNNFNLTIQEGETIALVGMSGVGKSTLGRIIACIELPTKGHVSLGSFPLSPTKEDKKHIRRKIQMIFQDHSAVLNPMMSIGNIIGEGIDIYGLADGCQATKKAMIAALLESVGLPSEFIHRYPHELSGGQKQRVGIARALSVEPDVIVCDEPLSALDLCTQDQILELLVDLKQKRKLTYIFITHDIDAIRHFADKIIPL